MVPSWSHSRIKGPGRTRRGNCFPPSLILRAPGTLYSILVATRAAWRRHVMIRMLCAVVSLPEAHLPGERVRTFTTFPDLRVSDEVVPCLTGVARGTGHGGIEHGVPGTFSRQHKGLHRGKQRVVMIGPRGQSILGPWLRPDEPGRPLFSPRDRMADPSVERRAARRSPLTPSQRARKPNPTGRGHRGTDTPRGATVGLSTEHAIRLESQGGRRINSAVRPPLACAARPDSISLASSLDTAIPTRP
jgi:hypothetical protein